MNKNILFLSFIAVLLLTFLNIKLYLNNKKTLNETIENKLEFEKKAKTIITLKRKLKNNLISFKQICNIKTNQIKCNNLDKNKFLKFNYAIKHINIKKLSIDKNKNSVDVLVEIE